MTTIYQVGKDDYNYLRKALAGLIFHRSDENGFYIKPINSAAKHFLDIHLKE